MKARNSAKNPKCIACKRPLQPVPIVYGCGPVCHPCYWAAKLKYENGITDVKDIPPALEPKLATIFRRGGYSWPFDLIWALSAAHFEKQNIERQRWWSPREED